MDMRCARGKMDTLYNVSTQLGPGSGPDCPMSSLYSSPSSGSSDLSLSTSRDTLSTAYTRFQTLTQPLCTPNQLYLCTAHHTSRFQPTPLRAHRFYVRTIRLARR
jgi:hypothetical protein